MAVYSVLDIASLREALVLLTEIVRSSCCVSHTHLISDLNSDQYFVSPDAGETTSVSDNGPGRPFSRSSYLVDMQSTLSASSTRHENITRFDMSGFRDCPVTIFNPRPGDCQNAVEYRNKEVLNLFMNTAFAFIYSESHYQIKSK